MAVFLHPAKAPQNPTTAPNQILVPQPESKQEHALTGWNFAIKNATHPHRAQS